MAIRISCPFCKARYPIDESLRGKRIACQECLKPLNIPAAKVAPQNGADAVAQIQRRPLPAAMPQSPQQWTPRQPVQQKQGSIPTLWLVGGGVALFGFVFMAVAAIGALILFVPGGLLAKDRAAQVTASQTEPSRNQRDVNGPQTTSGRPQPTPSSTLRPQPTKTAPVYPTTKQTPPTTAKKAIPAGWKEFTDKENGFSAVLPADAKAASEGPPAAALKGYKMEDRVVGRLFWVARQKVPANEAALPPDNQLDAVKQGLEAGSNIKVSSETKINIGKFPGREFEQVVQGPNGKVSIFTRVYVVDDSIYFLVAVSAGMTKGSAEYEAFFNSFKLLNK